MYIAILGFGYRPPAANLELAEQATAMLVERDFGIAVGNVSGTFLAALQTVDRMSARGIAVIDDSMSTKALPKSTRVEVVSSGEKHDQIARIATAGLVLGGAGGTLKLCAKLVEAGRPVAAIKGTGGAVDDGSLPESIPKFDSVEEAVEFLQSELTRKVAKETSSNQSFVLTSS